MKNLNKTFGKLVAELQTRLILHSPLYKKAMEVVASLPPDVFRLAMKEKLEGFSDEVLEEALEKLDKPETEMETKLVNHLASLGILEEVKQLTQQEVFLREHRRKHKDGR